MTNELKRGVEVSELATQPPQWMRTIELRAKSCHITTSWSDVGAPDAGGATVRIHEELSPMLRLTPSASSFDSSVCIFSDRSVMLSAQTETSRHPRDLLMFAQMTFELLALCAPELLAEYDQRAADSLERLRSV